MADYNTRKIIVNDPIEDFRCPICLDILIEPVTMPCRHELCLECFERHIAETSLTCPMCRLRIGAWTRKSHREKTLVNLERWQEIRKRFPKEVKVRLQPKRESRPKSQAKLSNEMFEK